MSEPVVLHQIVGSPNNKKVRIALHYKGIDYRSEPFTFEHYPGDRSPLVELSRQPLTPVLRHGERAIFDSGAILRYLEANFPGTRPLFTADYQAMYEIERWELFQKVELGPPVGIVFREALKPTPDPEAGQRASEQLRGPSAKLEERLAESEYLCGDALTAADVVCAPVVALAAIPEDAPPSPISETFRALYQLGDGRERTRAWIEKVMAWAERGPAGAPGHA